jgi:hypothetical protein
LPEDGAPLLTWTPWLGGSWSGKRQTVGNFAFRWAGAFSSCEDVALWHPEYANEIRDAAQHGTETAKAELHFAQNGNLISHESVRNVIHIGIEKIIKEVRVAMLARATQCILKEQAQMIISKEK